MIFILPFVIFYLLPWRMNRSRFRITMMLVVTSISTVFAVQFISMLTNEKIQEYIARGASDSAGISLTSVLAILLLGSTAIILRKSREFDASSSFFTVILLACAPSLMLLIFLVDVAVIGDRAWQLALLVFSTFFFTRWASVSLKRISLTILMVLTLVLQINVLVRYPLSNFFAPPFPHVDDSVRD